MSDWLSIMRHTIGADEYGRIRHDRNYFITGEGGKDWLTCVELVSAGYMTSRKGNAITGGDDIFFATSAGKEFVRINREPIPEPPKRTQAQSRYEHYRDVSECYDSFGAFLGIPETNYEYRDDTGYPDYRRVREYRMYRGNQWGSFSATLKGDWKPTKKEAKASYKAALKASKEKR
jgi:hypothetical protein